MFVEAFIIGKQEQDNKTTIRLIIKDTLGRYKPNKLLITQDDIHWKPQQLIKEKKVLEIYHNKSHSEVISAQHNLINFVNVNTLYKWK